MRVEVTEATVDTLFEGVLLDVNDPDGQHKVPGWKCRACCWTIGTSGLPLSHECPDEGLVQERIRAAAVEREACARIADAEADAVSPPRVPFDGGTCDAGRKIATKIRARSAL